MLKKTTQILIFFYFSLLSFPSLGQDFSVKFFWKKKTEDVKYFVDFYRDPQFKKLFHKETTKKNSIEFKLNQELHLRVLVLKKGEDKKRIRSIFMVYFKGNKLKIKNLKGGSFKILKYNPKKRDEDEKISLFFAMSSGNLREKGKSGQSSSVSLNSLATLGMAQNWKLDSSSFLSGSAYFSHLVMKYRDEKESTYEIGTNFYYNRLLKGTTLFPYGGFDLETFPIVNTDKLTSTSPLYLMDQKLLFLTAGLGSRFKTFNRPSVFKISASSSIYSFGDKNSLNKKRYQGYKWIMFYSISITPDWGMQTFLKKHLLSRAGELDITRYGLGVYRLF